MNHNANGPSRIVLVRHGQSEGNVKSTEDMSFKEKANHRFKLTKEGREQATAMGRYIQERFKKFDAYFCSTFLRTQETISLMYPDVSHQVDSRLNELWRGIWHTLSKEEVERIYPEEKYIRDREGQFHYRPPGGQSCSDVEVMIYSFLQDLSLFYSNKDILISAHGNWMLLFWKIITNAMPEDYEDRYQNKKYKNCSLAIYEKSNSSVLELVEDNVLC